MKKALTVMLLSVVMSFITTAVASELTLNGKLTQGSLVRGQLPAGSKVKLNGEALPVNQQGKFVFGFDRDASLEHTLAWTLPDGTEQQKTLTLSERDYVTQRIDGLDQKMVTPPESVLKRIRKDAANVYKARSAKSDNDALFTGFIWPAEGPVTGVYGSQRILNGKPSRPHFGLDVGSPTGTPVVAPVDGKVTLAEDLYYSGYTVVLDHGMGVFSTFLHLDTMTVDVGDTVSQGEKVGTIGETGRATGPHLDWRINLNNQRLDPELLVPPRN